MAGISLQAACNAAPTFRSEREKRVVHFFIDSPLSRRMSLSLSSCNNRLTACCMLFGPSWTRRACTIARPPDPLSFVSCSSVNASRTIRNESDSGANRASNLGPHKHFSSFLVDITYSFTRSSYASRVAVVPSQNGTMSKAADEVILSKSEVVE